MTAYPTIDELTWLFEDAPTMEFGDTGWPISAATWHTVRGVVEVLCTVAPWDRSVLITCTSGEGGLVTEIHLSRSVDSVSIDRTHGAEALTITCGGGSRLQPVRLQLRPRVELRVSASIADSD